MLDSNSKWDSPDVCIVCCRSISLFAYGICDHAVCYECSTRMRVLCEQNECPICRQVMPQVVFTWRLQKYADVDRRRFVEDRRHLICFEDGDAKKAYYKLLEHICNVCHTHPTFMNFQQLKDHMRKEHEQYYCDLCVNNLKIFSFERKSYRRQELARHRRTGDPDNTSHRGHPLCEFCEERFLDQDELFRHLRREHFFCHFCDADGRHEFYSCYEDLLEHFRMQHYLCEEGNCKEEKFTSVFRTDIDLRAHRATAHNKTMTKAQAKQARTLEFEFTIAPRQRPAANGPPISTSDFRDEPENRKGRHFHRRGRRDEGGAYGGADFFEPAKVATPVEAPTVSCSAEFPTLDGGNSNTSAGHHVTVRGNSGAAESFAQRLARQNRFTVHTTHENGNTDEEFPSLTMQSGPIASQPASPPVSARSSKRVMVQINSKKDFPGLPSSSSVTPSAASVVVNHPQSNVSIQVSRTTTHGVTSGGTNKQAQSSRGVNHARPTSWTGGSASLTDSDFPQLAAGGNGSTQQAEASWVTVKSNSNARAKTNTTQVMPGSRRDADADFPSLGGTSKKNQKISSNRSSSSVMIPISSNNDNRRSYLSNTNEMLSLQNVAESLLSSADTEADASTKNKNNKKKKQKNTGNENVDEGARNPSFSAVNTHSTTSWTTVSNSSKSKKNTEVTQPKNHRRHESSSQLRENQENESPDIGVKRAELRIDSFNTCSDLGDVITADETSSKAAGLVAVESDFPTLPPALAPIFNYQDKNVSLNIGSAWKQPTPAAVSGPPPGFIVSAKPAKANLANGVPPPGFNVTVNSVARSPVSSDSPPVMFTNSSGENFALSVVPRPPLHHQYSEPASFQERNAVLISRIQDMVSQDSGIFAVFKALSGQFRKGELSAADYYRQCGDLVGKDSFLDIFPELLVLLPDIPKQQELLSVHNNSRKQNAKSEAVCSAATAASPQFLVCAKCQQVLSSQDFRNHMNVHGLESNFPSLASAPVAPSSGTAWVKK